jgi:hypothetical protein
MQQYKLYIEVIEREAEEEEGLKGRPSVCVAIAIAMSAVCPMML